jgi:DNA-binding MarR family transcriptional regulator
MIGPLDQVPDDERHLFVLLGAAMERLRARVLELEVDGERLRPSQHRVLAMVPRDGAVSVTELAERVGMTKQAIGQFVRPLVERGYLVVEADPDDARRRMVGRTPRATDATRALTELLGEVEAEWAAAIGPRRWAQFRRTLEQVASL